MSIKVKALVQFRSIFKVVALVFFCVVFVVY